MSEFISLDVANLMRIFGYTALSFVIAVAWTPLLSRLLYKYHAAKHIKKADSPVYNKLHQGKENTPVLGGLLIWVTTLVLTLVFNLSRSQTYLPLFALISFALLGAFDDYLNIRQVGPFKGMRGRHKFIWQLVIAILGAWWFYYKLGWNFIHIPGVGDFTIGLWYLPLFVFVIVGMSNAVNITDGLDGLAGGLSAIVLFVLGGIAFIEGHFGLAIFCGTLVGATLAFVWFNIFPARFFMGDTGSLALGATIGVVAMLTDTIVVLPVIAFIFVIETLSVIIQVTYRKITGGKKIFLSSPFHHHLEAKGWPEPKVVMRFWVLGSVMAFLGFFIALIGRG
ncbi:MAG TPA: phospho-N-acetylmuramoyl-pentapeptide-transferase [Patescibacteria group bacterium]|nr:phospho-N-acetylmuramoyl-pentapeptide-transferase [Patescibacteria group bacterium]